MKASEIKKDLEKVVEFLEFCKTLPEKLSGIENPNITGGEYLDENINNLQNILKCFEGNKMEDKEPEDGEFVFITTCSGESFEAYYANGSFVDCQDCDIDKSEVSYWRDPINWDS